MGLTRHLPQEVFDKVSYDKKPVCYMEIPILSSSGDIKNLSPDQEFYIYEEINKKRTGRSIGGIVHSTHLFSSVELACDLLLDKYNLIFGKTKEDIVEHFKKNTENYKQRLSSHGVRAVCFGKPIH